MSDAAVMFVAWGISAAVIVVLAVVLGVAVRPGRGILGILIDGRGRYSLTHLQLVAWTIVVLSLISGVFWGRLLAGVDNPLEFSIPSEVLGLLGIAAGSGVATTVVKSTKDNSVGRRIAASSEADPPRFAQVFLAEEGSFADQVIDIAKFQNFVVTIVLVVAYVALAIDTIQDASTAADVSALPGFSGTFLTLLGISHAAYVAGKLPPQPGQPDGLTVANRGTAPDRASMPSGVAPRNVPSTI